MWEVLQTFILQYSNIQLIVLVWCLSDLCWTYEKLDLLTHSWNGTCSHVRDLSYSSQKCLYLLCLVSERRKKNQETVDASLMPHSSFALVFGLWKGYLPWLLGPMEGSGQLRAAKLFLRTCSLALIQTSPGQLPTAFRDTAEHSVGGQISHLWPWWPWLTWQGLGYPSSHLRALGFSSPSFSASSLIEPGPSQSFCALINLLEGEGDAAFLGTKPDHSP